MHRDDGWHLVDLGPVTRIRVNRAEVATDVLVRPGDVLRLGVDDYRFEVGR